MPNPTETGRPSSEGRPNDYIYRQEQQYMQTLLARYPFYFAHYRFFFPKGAIHETLAYYEVATNTGYKPDTPQETIDLVRCFVRQNIPKDVPLFRNAFSESPLFRTNVRTATRLTNMWEYSIKTYFSGRVSQERLPPKKDYATKATTFQAAQEWLVRAYRQKGHILQALYEINPSLLDYTEQHYFQGRTHGEIVAASARKATRRIVGSHTRLTLHSLGFTNETPPDVLNRYNRWLAPLLVNWERIREKLDSIPEVLKSPVGEIIRGKPITEVAIAYGLSRQNLTRFYNGLVGRDEISYRSFFKEHRKDGIKKLLEGTSAFELMLSVTLLQTVIAARIAGEEIKRIAKRLNLHDNTITAVTSHFLRDIQLEFADEELPQALQMMITSPYPFNMAGSRSVDTWKILQSYHERLVRKMGIQKQSLTTHQREFLLECWRKLEKGTQLTDSESTYLNLLFGNPQPNVQRREKREQWAQDSLKKRQIFASLTPQQQRIIHSLAEGMGITTIARREGLQRRQVLDLLTGID